METNRNALITELASFQEMNKAFITFRDDVQEQMELIFTAGQVMHDEMNDDAISKAYLPRIGKICIDLKKTIDSANNTIQSINKRIDQINEILSTAIHEEE